MPTHRRPRIDATILGAASLLALAMGSASAGNSDPSIAAPPAVVSEGVVAADLVGTWISGDGATLKLAPDGRYERSVKGRDKSAHGRYRIHDMSLQLRDDSGLSTTVTIYDGALDMAGHRLHRA
jgi:hypothetical protein